MSSSKSKTKLKQKPRASKTSKPRRRAPSPAYVGISSARIGRPGATQISVGSHASGHSLRCSGTEYLGIVQVPTSEQTDSVYTVKPNTCLLPFTRLKQFAEIYERWHPRVWRYRFIPSLPTSQKGTIVMAQEPDSAVAYVSTVTGNISRLRALEGSKMFQVWTPSSCDLAPSGDYTSLWTFDPSASFQESDRLDTAGSLVVACVAPTGLAAGSILGTLELDYTVDFFVPRIQSAPSSHTGEFSFSETETVTLFPDGGPAKPLFDTLYTRVKERYPVTPAGVSAVASDVGVALKLLKTLSSSSSLSASVDPVDSAIGFALPGNFRVKFVIASNEVTFVNPFISVVSVNKNITYNHGTLASAMEVKDYTALNGSVYDLAFVIDIDFGLDQGQRGYQDVNVVLSGLPDVSAFITDFHFSLSGADAYNVIDSASTTARLKKRTPLMMPRHMSSKGESKTPSTSDPVLVTPPPTLRHGAALPVTPPTLPSSSSSSSSSTASFFRR